MVDALERLDALLARIRSVIGCRAPLGGEAWRRNALATIRENVDMFRSEISDALATGSPKDGARAAAGVTGIRKGVSDLGELDRARDGGVLADIDEANLLALAIWSGWAVRDRDA